MQGRQEHNKAKQQTSYQRGDFQAWMHVDGNAWLIQQAEKLKLRCITIVDSHDIYIQDNSFLRQQVRLKIAIVLAPGIPIDRIVYVATKHDEPVYGPVHDESDQPKIIGKRTAVHIKILDYVLGLGLTMGLSFDGATYQRSIIFQQYVNMKYGFRDPSKGAACEIYAQDSSALSLEEETGDGVLLGYRYQLKKRIEENVLVEFELGDIQSRNDVIRYLMEYGTITYCSETAVSLYNEDHNDRFRFKGGVFSLNSFDAHLTKADIHRSELGFPLTEPEPQHSFPIQEIEQAILDALTAQNIKSRNDLLCLLMKFSNVIYLSQHQIIIKTNNEQKQYNLYGGLFSEDGLQDYLRESRQQDSPKGRNSSAEDPSDILRSHRITERDQFHDAFRPASAQELLGKLKTLYEAGKTRLRTRFEKAERRLLKNIETAFNSHGLPGLDTLGFSDLFDSAPFPNFPDAPRGHCGPCNVAPVPRNELQATDRPTEEQELPQRRASPSCKNDKQRTGRTSEAEHRHDPNKQPIKRSSKQEPTARSNPVELDGFREEVSERNGKQRHGDTHDRRLEIPSRIPTGEIKNGKQTHDHASDSTSNLKALLGLIPLLSGIKDTYIRIKSALDEARARRRRIRENAQQIERKLGELSLHGGRSTNDLQTGNAKPRHTNRETRENGRSTKKGVQVK